MSHYLRVLLTGAAFEFMTKRSPEIQRFIDKGLIDAHIHGVLDAWERGGYEAIIAKYFTIGQIRTKGAVKREVQRYLYLLELLPKDRSAKPRDFESAKVAWKEISLIGEMN